MGSVPLTSLQLLVPRGLPCRLASRRVEKLRQGGEQPCSLQESSLCFWQGLSPPHPPEAPRQVQAGRVELGSPPGQPSHAVWSSPVGGSVEGTCVSCSHPTRGSQVGTLVPAEHWGCARERELLLCPAGQWDPHPHRGTLTRQGGLSRTCPRREMEPVRARGNEPWGARHPPSPGRVAAHAPSHLPPPRPPGA